MNENKTLKLFRRQSGGITMDMSRVTLTLSLLVVAMAVCIGCYPDATGPTNMGTEDRAQQLAKADGPAFMNPGDTSQCATTLGSLLPNKNLKLLASNSEVEYTDNSVLLPVPVSFSICRLDSTGTFLKPKAAVFGPYSNLQFLREFKVNLDPVDAGLPANIRDGTYYRLYRQNEVTGQWDSVLIDRIKSHKVKYEIKQNGTYAITLANLAIDTTWRATALIPPTGGTINLLGSSVVIPKGALADSTLITFDYTTGVTNVGLPGATDRAFEFGPEGLVFQSPVTLYVSFDDAGYTGEEAKATPLKFYYFNPSASTWVQQPTVMDWENQQFVVTLSHFSRYAFGR